MSAQSSKDRSNLCIFTFADGRQCTQPQSPDDEGLCYFHARKFIDQRRAQMAGKDIARLLDADITTACDLNAVFCALFSATAQGYLKPKTAHTLAYLGQLLLQTQRLAKEEFLQTFSKDWTDVVWESPTFNTYHPLPDALQERDAEPAPEPTETAPHQAVPEQSPHPSQPISQPVREPVASPEPPDSTASPETEHATFDPKAASSPDPVHPRHSERSLRSEEPLIVPVAMRASSGPESTAPVSVEEALAHLYSLRATAAQAPPTL